VLILRVLDQLWSSGAWNAGVERPHACQAYYSQHLWSRHPCLESGLGTSAGWETPHVSLQCQACLAVIFVFNPHPSREPITLDPQGVDQFRKPIWLPPLDPQRVPIH